MNVCDHIERIDRTNIFRKLRVFSVEESNITLQVPKSGEIRPIKRGQTHFIANIYYKICKQCILREMENVKGSLVVFINYIYQNSCALMPAECKGCWIYTYTNVFFFYRWRVDGNNAQRNTGKWSPFSSQQNPFSTHSDGQQQSWVERLHYNQWHKIIHIANPLKIMFFP